jgi:hypothetical protein
VDFDGAVMALTARGDKLSMRNCTFANNSLPLETLTAAQNGSAVLPAAANVMAMGAYCGLSDFSTEDDTLVRLQGCHFSNSSTFPALARQTHPNVTASFFTDMPDIAVHSVKYPSMCEVQANMSDFTLTKAQGLNEVPENESLPSMDDEWIFEAQQVCQDNFVAHNIFGAHCLRAYARFHACKVCKRT